METPAAGFRFRLSAAMEAAAINKRQLSERSGVSRPTIDAWLAGGLPREEEKVRQVAATLGVPFEDLWGAAPLEASERTQLSQLRTFAFRVRQMLDAMNIEPEPEPGAELRTMQPEVVSRPAPAPRRRGRSA